MEEISERRNPLRRQFGRLEVEVNKLLNEKTPDVEAVSVAYRLFCDSQSQLFALDEKAFEKLLEQKATDEEQDAELEEVTSYKRRAEVVRCKYEKLTIPARDNENVTTSVISGETRRNFKLPQVEIKKFNGNLMQWLGFWAQFEKIHQETTLHDSDKFQYILQSLQPDSEPFLIVSGYPQSAENYPKAVDALKRRYGDEDLLLQVYIRELLGLVISNVNSKDKVSFKNLYMKLDSHLRALKSLNLEKADPASWLFPLVESSLPEDILYSWQRSHLSSYDGSKDTPPRTRLDIMMEFMEKEVQIKQRIEISKSFNPATNTRSAAGKSEIPAPKPGGPWRKPATKSASEKVTCFHVATSAECVFCNRKGHFGEDCYTAKRMQYEAKKDILKKKAACFNCFRHHIARNCTAKNLKCATCGGKHHTVICSQAHNQKQSKLDEPPAKKQRVEDPQVVTRTVEFANVGGGSVSLQTLMVKIVGENNEKIVRAFLDSGSQRSYLLNSTAEELQLKAKAEERVIHCLFGGNETGAVVHKKYDINVKPLNGVSRFRLEVRDQQQICNNLCRISPLNKKIMHELQSRKIELTDIGVDSPPIELLIGADFYGKILTGNVQQLQQGAVAVETRLGWTLVGELGGNEGRRSVAEDTLTMTVTDICLPKLWELDQLGITDPVEVATAEARENAAKELFFSTLSREEDGRYSVKLPWKEGFSLLPTNKTVAIKRLEATTRKLVTIKLFDAYGQLFSEWEKEGFIERVGVLNDGQRGHYLPHRAVVKMSSLTTPVRPVFDASCRAAGMPALNDCLHKGTNLILLIPDILLRFREKPVAFIADIRKAFQMIGVDVDDRDFLRFLWWTDKEMQEHIEYRHARVPFGANCSPFILGAVLEYHLTSLPDNLKVIGLRLLRSLYVDNCVGSEDTEEDYRHFRTVAVDLLKEARMDLRLWESNLNEENTELGVSNVLGLKWDRKVDELFVDISQIRVPEKLTKREVLSIVQKVYDPIGFTCSSIIPIKVLLQRAWKKKLKWDEPLPESESSLFRKWCEELNYFDKMRIPRLMTSGVSSREKWQLHTFTDGSGHAYAAAVYLRTESLEGISVQLIAAKARVAPVATTTIPRLELLGCLLGARLTASVVRALQLDGVPALCWSDSSTALAWIRRNEQWGTFVGNRTAEINKLTKQEAWRFVPGECNPADLPSRGCSPSKLYELKWWRGPDWLLQKSSAWPESQPETHEEEIFQEKRKSTTVSMSCIDGIRKNHSYQTLVRITALVKRFIQNCRCKEAANRKLGEVTEEELNSAEIALIRSIQNEVYSEEKLDAMKCVKGMELFRDTDYDILRVKTRLTHRDDTYDFRFPFLLPGKHPIVRQLIWDTHWKFYHAGVGFVVTHLRNKYWILHTRQSVRHVLSKCFRCRRLTAKSTVTPVAGLPVDRVRDAEPFEVTGIDLAGPFVLKNQKKAWLVIFTCAIYRAIHLEVVDSLSTIAFIRSMDKFVKRFRRPAVIYSDNGTNFRGAAALFRKLDWSAITKEQNISQIDWKFNCSTASWWGGFWERMIRSVKDLIRRSLGKGQVNKKELERCVHGIAEVINGRPLTYVSESTSDLEPLTPAMFIHPYGNISFPELDLLEADKLRFRYQYVQTLKRELHARWRKEYLGLLVAKPQKPTKKLIVGELVVVSDDNKRRHEWELARIVELLPGKDGVPRMAKIKTSSGVYSRPVQRLHPLEMDSNKNDTKEKEQVCTRAKRVSRPPERYE